MRYLIVLLLLSSCGKECKFQSTETQVLDFGTLEVIHCPEGEVIGKVQPHLLPGGIVTHYTATCIKQEMVCH